MTPTNIEPRDYLLTRTRQTYFGTFDYAPNATTNFSLRANLNNFSDQENRWRTRYRPGTFQPGDSATASRVERTLRYRKLDDYFQTYTLRGEHTAQKYTLDGTAGWSRARETNPFREEVTFRQSATTIQYNVKRSVQPARVAEQGQSRSGEPLFVQRADAELSRRYRSRPQWPAESHRAVQFRVVGGRVPGWRGVSRQAEELDRVRHRDDEVSGHDHARLRHGHAHQHRLSLRIELLRACEHRPADARRAHRAVLGDANARYGGGASDARPQRVPRDRERVRWLRDGDARSGQPASHSRRSRRADEPHVERLHRQHQERCVDGLDAVVDEQQLHERPAERQRALSSRCADEPARRRHAVDHASDLRQHP